MNDIILSMSRSEMETAGLLIRSFRLPPDPTDRVSQAQFLLENGFDPKTLTVEALLESDVVRNLLVTAYNHQHPNGFVDFTGLKPDEDSKGMPPEEAIKGELDQVWFIMKRFKNK